MEMALLIDALMKEGKKDSAERVLNYMKLKLEY